VVPQAWNSIKHRTNPRDESTRRGFTLLELLVVIAINESGHATGAVVDGG
jgi:type II secretory pathway component PulJ